MNEEKNNLNNGFNRGPWWKPGVEMFSEISTWIIVPIVLALIFGKMLDTHYGTKPVLFLSLAIIAFLFSCYKIYRITKNYMQKIKNNSEKK
jgi:F0F1-type ATP synthase assembly protein I